MSFLISNSAYFLKCFDKYAINTPLRVAHFLAQVAHESTNFTRLEENLNYSVDGLRATPPFNNRLTNEQKERYGRTTLKSPNKQMIANIGYANKLGNGNVASGDGYKYRGRGFIQLTGKGNYQAYKNYSGIDVVTNPDLASTIAVAIDIAGWFWASKKLNAVADSDNVKLVTKLINGGSNGLKKRIEKLQVYKKLDVLGILKKKIQFNPIQTET